VAGGVALVGVLMLTAWRISQGDTSLGNFVGLVGAVAVIAPEVRALGTLSAVAQEGGAAADRVFDVLDAPLKIADRSNAAVLGRAQGALAFEHVSFAYGEGSPAVEDLTFKIAAKQTVAIVGPSGAGKSTLFSLLMRLYDPQTGRVFIDGCDVTDVSVASLRSQFALVSQTALLFDDTIQANIGLGRMEASQEEVEAAARAASAHAFIEAMPNGYDTVCGEGGGNLSGGQRQRVALARAILRDAPVLLLDEATSALDAETEAAVQTALDRFARDRTVLVIAHRLSTVKRADLILVLDQGRIVEQGSHNDLIAAGGLYARLAELQLSS
ncbi:MAG: ABC transporter ATP-binding protein, partial [Pseudomonadota bacterium]